MADGWIKLHRKLQDNPVWLSEPFTRGQAWVDLLLMANHDYGYFFLRGNKVEIQRGEIARGEESFSSRWKWSRGKVRGFLNQLENEQQIEQQKSNIINKIIIINYDSYQKEDNRPNSRKTAERQQKDINNNDNNNNNEKKKDIEAPKKPPKPTQGTRLSEDWELPEEWGDWALSEFNWDIPKVVSVMEKFKDHWLAKAGADGVKLNWQSTWKNWCRREYEGVFKK